MSRRWKILRNVGIGLAALLLIVGVTTIVIVQTDWFRNFVRQKIITATEEGTGGRVTIGAFSFNPWRLEAVVTNFVIHGNEPAAAAPFVSVGKVQVNIRLFTSLRRLLDVSFLRIEKPAVNILAFADGRTNIPTPKDKKPSSDKTILDTVIDLAVDRFQITDGLLTLNAQKQEIDLKGNNLRALLLFNLLKQSYQGELSMQPMYVVAGRNTPVVFTVTLPVVLERNRVGFDNAKITTPASELTINGSLEDLKNPKTSARINGRLALTDLKNLTNAPLDLNAGNLPSSVEIAGNASIAENRISVSGLRATLGSSNIEASGTLKDPDGNGALEFKTQLALGELGRLAKVSARPEGTVVLNGTAKLDAANNYQATGNIEARNVSITQGAQRIRNINLFSAVSLDPKRLDLKGLRLSAFGGEFAGDVGLEEFARYKVNGTLRNLDVQNLAAALGQKRPPYSGVISGPLQASGDTKSPGTRGITASARLTISPGRRGVPVSGRLNADYNGATDNINISNSYVALPNTRLNLSGSLNNRLNLELTTRDLNDLLAAASPTGKPPVTLNGGHVTFTGAVTGGLTTPRITGHLAADRFSVEGRQFDSLAADVAAAKNGASLSNGMLARGPMQAQFSASAGLQNWAAKPTQPLTAAVQVTNGDLADVMVLAGRPATGYSGALTMNADVKGTIGNPMGTANLQVLNGTIENEPFDRIQAQVNLSDQLVTVPAASISAGPAQVNLTAEFQHPRDSFTTGRLHASVRSNDINLAQLRALQKQRPNTAGLLNINADVTGNLATVNTAGKDQSEFLLTAVNGAASARNLRFEGQNYGDFNAKAVTIGQTVQYDVKSDFAGSDIQVNGSTQLARGYPTTADAKIGNLPVERLLVLAKRSDIPARGNLSGTAHLTGTMENPQGSVDLDLANANLYDEPIDHVRARISYLAQTIDVPRFEIIAGPARIEMTARYDHPAGNLNAGNVQFKVNSSGLDLARIRNVQKSRPGLGGTLQITASGAGSLQQGTPQFLFRDLNADIGARSISAQGRNFGDLTLKANTTAGVLKFALDSNLAASSIQASGDARLTGDYPVNAKLRFSNVTWQQLQPLLGPSTGTPPTFDVITEGELVVNGPAVKPEQIQASLQIPKLQMSTIPDPTANEPPVVIRNSEPISIALDKGTVRVRSARLTGPQTEITATGTAALIQGQNLDLSLNANTNLGLLQSFSRDIFSSGNVLLVSTVRGTLNKPLINGRLELKNASLNYVDLPNGISNANGLIAFNGSTATIRTLTAESGGGKVRMSGFVSLENTLRLGLRVNAQGVRVRPQPGVSLVASTFINLTGTSAASVLSGVVTINQITYAPQSDFGSILSRSAPPVQAPATPNPLLDNMKLDIRVRTSSSTAVQASLAQNLQLDADIRVRGVASRPGVLGRISVTEGDLVFFGSEYRVSSGTISFYNPVRIEPVLNISLETQAKGVNVVLTVTGPVDNMKLTYTSDPPLQFQEIVSLLASGKTPTSDPTLLANQPSAPQQSYQQMGESAIVSKAIADPVSSRLQRVFGVSQLKIDPTFTSGSDLPQARVTLQQQVATNITFTYVTALEDPNTQIVRVEWSLNPQWSAVANRDENGIFSINFLYKKQFR